jgi:hypothetical protein
MKRTITVTEAQFQGQIIDLAHLCGYLVTHFRAAKTMHGWRTPLQGDKGYLDTTMARPNPPRHIVAELKSEKGRITADEQLWYDTLKAAGVECYIWRPRDFYEAARIIRARTRAEAETAPVANPGAKDAQIEGGDRDE